MQETFDIGSHQKKHANHPHTLFAINDQQSLNIIERIESIMRDNAPNLSEEEAIAAQENLGLFTGTSFALNHPNASTMEIYPAIQYDLEDSGAIYLRVPHNENNECTFEPKGGIAITDQDTIEKIEKYYSKNEGIIAEGAMQHSECDKIKFDSSYTL